MADISLFQAPNGDEFNIKDTTARADAATAATTVTQSPTITDGNYEILFSGSADNTEHTEIVRKAPYFIFNPNTKTAFIGIKATGDWTPGSYSFGTGYFNEISGDYSHAEGYGTIASGDYSHAEGYRTIASGSHSHAEGDSVSVSGSHSHAEGYHTTASGAYASHAEGYLTIASGSHSHAEGQYTTANHASQHTFGEFNILDDSQAASTARGNYVEIVGNGNADARSNARTLDWSGNEWIAGKLTVGTAPTNDMDVTTKKYVDDKIADLPEPMLFKGSLGTGGTITTLPTASASNEGFTYKVITDGTYAGQAAKVGDTFISDGTAWVLIPSGDEPSGTVTSVGFANGGGIGLSGTNPITSSGTVTITNTGVRSTTINGNYLRVNTNGINSDLTIPFATNSTNATKATQDGSGNTITSTYLPLSGGTMTGQIILASSALKTNESAGWTMNQYGNLVHQRATTTDYWAIANNAGTYKFQVHYETGAVTAAGNLTAPKFIGALQGNADTATKATQDGSGNVITSSYTPYKGNLNGTIGSGSPAADMKTYWDNNDNIKTNSVNTAYNNAGQEYAFLLSKGNSNQYGAVIRWGYATKYFEILRKYGSTWKDSDWVKMDAGYADTAGSATKATQDGSGNVITSTYLPLAGGTVTGMTTFDKTIHSDGGQHLYGGGATNSIWYKITLATNGLTPPSSQQWYMCSLSLDIGGDYNSGAKGRIELSYYIHWSGSAFAATNVYGFASGANMQNVEVYYKLTEPFIIYVKTLNQYSSLWVRNVTYRDSAYTFRTLETKVETSSAITVENYTAIPISRLYTSNGTYLTTNSSLVPQTNNELYLGSSNSKWSYVYATKFIGALQGNADTATTANKARLLSDETIRPTSANTTTYNGALRYFLSSSSMTTGKPIADGGILSMEWDNNSGCAKQLYLDHSGGVKTIMQVRSQNAGTWGSWIPVGVFRQTTPTSGQVVITDGTDGGIKSSGYTIATSVPSGAVFTDTKNTAGSTDTSSKIFLIGATSQAANPQTYSDDQVYVTSGTLQVNIVNATAGINANTANSGTAGGLALWGTSPVAYGLAMRNTSNGSKFADVQADYAIYSYMTNSSSNPHRGWIWKNVGVGNVASIDCSGNAAFKGYVTVGANATNTSGVRAQYNSTTKSLDFVFVS